MLKSIYFKKYYSDKTKLLNLYQCYLGSIISTVDHSSCEEEFKQIFFIYSFFSFISLQMFIFKMKLRLIIILLFTYFISAYVPYIYKTGLRYWFLFALKWKIKREKIEKYGKHHDKLDNDTQDITQTYESKDRERKWRWFWYFVHSSIASIKTLFNRVVASSLTTFPFLILIFPSLSC